MKHKALEQAITVTLAGFKMNHPETSLPENIREYLEIKPISNGFSLQADFHRYHGQVSNEISRFRFLVNEKQDSTTLDIAYFLYPEAAYDPKKTVPDAIYGNFKIYSEQEAP